MKAIPYEEATALIAEVGGIANQDRLAAVLGSIEQTFDGQPLYPDVETRAAHLLYFVYFVIKDHALLDGTKRGAVVLFDEYLKRNERQTMVRQTLGQIVQQIEAGVAGRAHQEQMIARIINALPSPTPTA